MILQDQATMYAKYNKVIWCRFPHDPDGKPLGEFRYPVRTPDNGSSTNFHMNQIACC